jgi:hypothetical protein
MRSLMGLLDAFQLGGVALAVPARDRWEQHVSHIVLINPFQWSCLSTAAFRRYEIVPKSVGPTRCGSAWKTGGRSRD